MKTLILLPTAPEMNFFLKGWSNNGVEYTEIKVAGCIVSYAPEYEAIVALGGLGKVQFAVQTRYFLDHLPDCELAICAGAAGALVDGLAIGDIIIGTETVEHDIRKKSRPMVPRFPGDNYAINKLKANIMETDRVYFGGIASGDEDIMDADRRQKVREITNALVVAWEGAGGARACQLTQIPYLEMRVIVDAANEKAETDFRIHLNSAMQHLAKKVLELLKCKIRIK